VSLPPPDRSSQVLVTGASSGIGEEIARLLAERGHDLTIVARRRERLDELAEALRLNDGREVWVQERDLGQGAERAALIAELEASERAVVGVCNCAGFGTSGRFHELGADRELEQVELNVVALVELARAFVEPMVAAGAGAILNVASIAAFQPLPGLATYGATKAFVQSFSEAVHEELRGTGVSCTVLCPGPVPTEWADVADAQAAMVGPAQVDPGDVAAAAVEGMVKGRRSVVPGLVPQALALAGRYTPRTALLPALHFHLGR
jgi:short-subunit dehydrogenase